MNCQIFYFKLNFKLLIKLSSNEKIIFVRHVSL